MDTLTPLTPEIDRDRFGRPMVVPLGGGKPTAYTRCTTFVGCVEDTYNLSKWQMRMVAVGLSERPDLRLAVAAHREDKKLLDGICDDALEAAKAHAAATTGTALHSLTERLDRGLELGTVPDEYLADLAAYQQATAELDAVLIEQFTVQDFLKVGGTPDRVVRYRGKRYIADLKTGSINYGYLKIAAQLAMYARSKVYDIETAERTEHGADLERGIVIHLPAGTGTCNLYWVDLLAGWEACKTARSVREKRSRGFKQYFQPFGDDAPHVYQQLALVGDDEPVSLATRIKAATSEAAVRDLWREHASEWTDAHTNLAKQQIAALASK